MRLMRLTFALALLTTGWWIGGGQGSAAQLTDASWWWRGNMGPAPLPAPATVPADGLYVAGTPDGASAIAAVRYQLAVGESNPVLTLTVADNGAQGADAAVIGACVAGSAWGGGEQGGPWDAKPNAACQSGSVQGLPSADHTSWTFALAPLVVAGEVNVVITPGSIAADTPVGSTFSIAFAPVTGASVATTPDAGSSDAGAVPPSAAGFDPAAEGGGLDLGPTFGGDSAGVSAFTPALPSSDQELTATAPVVRQATAANILPTAPEGAGGSGLAFAVIVALMAVAYRLNRLPVPGLRRLGPLASSVPHAPALTLAPEPGGLGRFARPRTGAPPPLT
jgi:hypothetical protein